MQQQNRIDQLYYSIEEGIEGLNVYLKCSKSSFEESLCSELDKITDEGVPGEYTKVDIELNTIGRWESEVIEYFVQSFTLLSWRFLEKFINEICNHIKSHRNIKLSYKDINGKGLERHKKYLKTFGGFKFQTDIFGRVNELYVLRNSIIHGREFNFDTDEHYEMNPLNNNERKLKLIVERKCGIQDQFGSLRFGIEFCDYCLSTIANFFYHLKKEHKNNFKIRNAQSK